MASDLGTDIVTYNKAMPDVDMLHANPRRAQDFALLHSLSLSQASCRCLFPGRSEYEVVADQETKRLKK